MTSETRSPARRGMPSDEIRRRLAAGLTFHRNRTKLMINPLDWDDLHKQHNDIMSPLVWDVGHIGNFEEYWLLREVGGLRAHDLQYDEMYNPFDNPRWSRGDLPLLERDEAVEYMDEVRGDALAILDKADLDGDDPLVHDGYVFQMIIQHEAQHQETVLQALNMRTDLAPYPLVRIDSSARQRSVDDTERVSIAGGPFQMGSDDAVSTYDNERPGHAVEVATFSIDKFPVTNRRYGEFIDAGGYDSAEWWSDDGWAWRSSVDHQAPQGWTRKVGGGWLVNRFGHVLDLDPTEPVVHVSYFEAEAFAKWAGGRLPTESEWEKAATWGPSATAPRTYPWGESVPDATKANVGHVKWGPASVGSHPAGASAYGVEQMLGDAYEWTSSEFVPYPGFSVFPYPEYSEVFFGDPEYRVLRGASWATSVDVTRSTFRNWDYRLRRQIFSGIRLAWDV